MESTIEPTIPDLEAELSAIPARLKAAESAFDLDAALALKSRQQAIPGEILRARVALKKAELESRKARLAERQAEAPGLREAWVKAEDALKEAQRAAIEASARYSGNGAAIERAYMLVRDTEDEIRHLIASAA